MTARTVVEFLPGQPATGKSAADISSDGRKVVFQDWAEQTRLYEANLDGTGLREIPVDCTCALLYPDYDPTATRIVYVRVQGEQSWLEIRDLATDEVTKIESPSAPPRTRCRAARLVARRQDDRLQPDHMGSPQRPRHRHGPLRGPSPEVRRHIAARCGDGHASRAADTVEHRRRRPELVAGQPDDRLRRGSGLDDRWRHRRRSSTRTTPSGETDGAHRDRGLSSPEYLPDGQHILYKTFCIGLTTVFCDTPDSLGVMLADFSAPLWVNEGGMDLTDLPQGFSRSRTGPGRPRREGPAHGPTGRAPGRRAGSADQAPGANHREAIDTVSYTGVGRFCWTIFRTDE